MIKKILIITLVCCMMTFLMIAGSHEETFACCSRGVSPSGHFGSSPHNGVTLPPPIVPPGFPYRWETSDVVDSFKEKKLAVTEVSTVTKADSSLPAKVKEMSKFSFTLSGEQREGYIFSFEKKKNLLKSQKHYLELNERGELYTWSFVKDNILLVLAGSIPEEKARLYESVLYELEE
jgi:hypothetical protein